MTFTPEQNAELDAPLSSNKVKKRKQAGFELSYIEGWQAISEANRIFGFDGWNRETVLLEQCGEPREVNDKARVAYLAKVRVTVGEVVREGIGYGSGIAKDLGDAFESAIKEAETDAMKRALMTFGNPFGLALYDKTQANVIDEPRNVSVKDADWQTGPAKNREELRTKLEHLRHDVLKCDDLDELKGWVHGPDADHAPLIQQIKNNWIAAWDSTDDPVGLKQTIEKRRDELKAREADSISYAA